MSHLEQKDPGLIHLYVGDGKGKTTCAAGLALRAAGQGLRVLFCQFLKGRPTGEIPPLERLGIQVLRAKCTGKFLNQMTPAEREAEAALHTACLERAGELIRSGGVDLVVLDEAVDAENCAMFPPGLLESLLGERGPVEIVLTGRNPSPALRELAHYHTAFTCVSHPYQQGVQARRGIEY